MSLIQPALERHLITPEMLESLPAPVQRYMRFSGVVGQPWIDTVLLKYRGRFRMADDKPWMGMSVHQVYTTNPPGFHWKARFSMAGIPLMFGSDTYKNAHGHMFGKLLNVRTIFDARGDELDQGTMLRYLQEMAWFPVAYLCDYITWEGVSDHCADVTFTDGGRTVSARMYFDDEGRLLTFIARRYGDFPGGYRLENWAAPMFRYRSFGGLRVPTQGAGVWQLASGDFSYIELTIDELIYNQPIETF